MATVTINNVGVGGTQSGTVTTAGGAGGGSIMVSNDSDSPVTFDVATGGTVVQSKLKCAPKAFLIVSGLNNGAQTLVNLTNAHGTSAQNNEIVYNTLIT